LNASMNEVNSARAQAVLSAADRATGVTRVEAVGVGDGATVDGSDDVQAPRASVSSRKTLKTFTRAVQRARGSVPLRGKD